MMSSKRWRIHRCFVCCAHEVLCVSAVPCVLAGLMRVFVPGELAEYGCGAHDCVPGRGKPDAFFARLSIFHATPDLAPSSIHRTCTKTRACCIALCCSLEEDAKKIVRDTDIGQDGEYRQIEGLWLGMRRKDEELAELRQQLELAQVQSKEGQVEIESLLREKKALKDFQSMVRG